MSQTYINTDECWLWAGTNNGKGYGTLYAYGVKHMAHRVLYEHFKGEIPEGYHIDHLCRVTYCVNPDHLEAVTPKENILRGTCPMADNARKTHCPQGHEYTKDNIMFRGKNRTWRACKACNRELSRVNYAKVKLARASSYI